MKTGVVYLKIRMELNQDIDEEEAVDLVNELYYEIKDDKDRIQNTMIVGHDLTSTD